MISWSPRCYIPSFVEIGSPDPEILKGFYHIWAWWPSWSCDQHHVVRFSLNNFLVPESFHKKLVQIGKLVSEKIWFEFLYVHDLRPLHDLRQGQEMTLTFNTHIPSFIELDVSSY